MKPHWEALTPKTREAFHTCAQLPFIQNFYLAGGTGLALHLGHRFSVDLDFFTDVTDSVDAKMRTQLKKKFRDPSLELTHDKDATFVAKWQGVGISFFELYEQPLVERTIDVEGIALARLGDIGALKLSAAYSRATRKDLVDLYYILQHVSLEELFRVAARKFPRVRSFPVTALLALSYFDDADKLPMPRMIDKTPWPQMKKFLTKQATDDGRRNFERFWD